MRPSEWSGFLIPIYVYIVNFRPVTDVFYVELASIAYIDFSAHMMNAVRPRLREYLGPNSCHFPLGFMTNWPTADMMDIVDGVNWEDVRAHMLGELEMGMNVMVYLVVKWRLLSA